MNNLEKILKEDKKFLVTFVVGGYPSIEKCTEIMKSIFKHGGDIVEIGIPYNEALADGKVISEIYLEAIKNKVRIKDILNSIEGFKDKPIVIMSYYNPIYCYGVNKFLEDLERVGVSGLIVPDIPLEERELLKESCEKLNISLVPLVTRMSKDRIEKIAKGTKGFVYAVSVNGITGERKQINLGTKDYINYVKEKSKAKTFLGFGISNVETVDEVKAYCDGVIIGSAIMKRIERGEEIGGFISKLRISLDSI